MEFITTHFFSPQSPSSTTPPIEINSSRLTKLMRRSTDKKSEFLKALKDDRNGEMPERHENNKLEDVRGQFSFNLKHYNDCRGDRVLIQCEIILQGVSTLQMLPN